MENWMWVIWLSCFVLALIIEGIGTDLVSVWFAFGALVALIISFIPEVSWWIELIVFLVVSIAALLCVRPLAHKYLRRGYIRSNVDEIIGKKAELTEEITPLKRGEIQLNDMKWTAIASDEKAHIEKGELVIILAIEGNKLIVKKAEISDNKEPQGPKGDK